LACGTPVVTYNTGGSPEAIDAFTGIVVDKGNISGLSDAIHQLSKQDRDMLRTACRNRAEQFFDKNIRSNDYIKLFENLLSSQS
jgi:glycosyltransferase involved in cell wall biosynthesis